MQTKQYPHCLEAFAGYIKSHSIKRKYKVQRDLMSIISERLFSMEVS